MSHCSELLMSKCEGVEEEPLGCVPRTLRTVRERRELYLRHSRRWSILAAVLRVVETALGMLGFILLLARLGGIVEWSLYATLGICTSLTGFSVLLQLCLCWLAPEARAALYNGAAQILSDAFDLLNADTSANSDELERWAEKELAKASELCEPSGRLTVVIIR